MNSNYYNQEIPGWMSDIDLNVLKQLASHVPENGSILEVGCFLGKSTYALFSGKPQTAKLEVIDTFEINDSYSLNPTQLKLQGSERLSNEALDLANKTGSWLESFKHCITSEVADQLKINVISSEEYKIVDKFNMVFIDANHSTTSVLADIKKYTKEDNLIVGDDFKLKWPGISLALCAIREEQAFFDRTLIVPSNSKIWIMVPSTGHWADVFRKNILG